MEFHIQVAGPRPDLEAIENSVRTVDPAGVIDIAANGLVRVAAAVNADELVTLVRQAGIAVEPGDIIRIPSTCCGGCSG